jgi:hypothetical protein
MKRYPVHPKDPFAGLFSDLFIVGTTRGAAGVSDFTAAATTQTITLLALNIGDILPYPLAQGLVAKRFTDGAEDAAATTLANLKADVGVTSATTQLIAGTNGDLQQDRGYPITSPTSGLAPYSTIATGKSLLLTLTSTAGNLNTITFGELWIYTNVMRVADYLTTMHG